MFPRIRQVHVACAVLLFSAAGLAGCGGAYDASASGVVTLDGNVVPRGTVAFHPVAGGPSGSAHISASGEYQMRIGREEGLPPGEYQVTVVANEPPTVTQTATGAPPPPGKPITPAWYASKDSSGLKVVVESGDNELNLELNSQPPAGWTPPARQ